jgi:hypothetical protein
MGKIQSTSWVSCTTMPEKQIADAAAKKRLTVKHKIAGVRGRR